MFECGRSSSEGRDQVVGDMLGRGERRWPAGTEQALRDLGWRPGRKVTMSNWERTLRLDEIRGMAGNADAALEALTANRW